jgi:hypothetical protein
MQMVSVMTTHYHKYLTENSLIRTPFEHEIVPPERKEKSTYGEANPKGFGSVVLFDAAKQFGMDIHANTTQMVCATSCAFLRIEFHPPDEDE